jgi:radial spoke head protein 9
MDFLDNLVQDQPQGVWSIQVSNDEVSVNCKNLLWPGYYAFHKLNTNIFGSAYIGDGIKNIDLAFML